jgi:hypothetical protein
MYKYGHWDSKTKIEVEKYFGFVYMITNKITQRKYIGKKQFHSYRKKKKVKESDWLTYTSSSQELNQDIINFKKNNFKFEILQLYKTRGGLVYGEANLQHKFDVLTSCDKHGNREFYNGQIGAIKFLPKEYYP